MSTQIVCFKCTSLVFSFFVFCLFCFWGVWGPFSRWAVWGAQWGFLVSGQCWFCHFFSLFSWMLRSLLSSVGHAPAYSRIDIFCRLHLVNKCCFIGVQNCVWHWSWMCAYMDGMVSVVGLSGSCHLAILSSPECVKHLSYLDLMVQRDWTTGRKTGYFSTQKMDK